MFARLLLLVLMAALPAAAQDYAREKRWADEVVPGLVVGDAVWLETSAGRKFLAIHAPASKPRGAVILVHGIGIHPDYGMIGVLRSKLTDLGWTTLSIQMPVQAADARFKDYTPPLFEEASDRIGKAAAWLAAKGDPRIALVSHNGTVLLFLAHLLALPLPLVWCGFYSWPASVSTIHFEEHSDAWAAPRALCVADTSHLRSAGLEPQPRGMGAGLYEPYR